MAMPLSFVNPVSALTGISLRAAAKECWALNCKESSLPIVVGLEAAITISADSDVAAVFLYHGEEVNAGSTARTLDSNFYPWRILQNGLDAPIDSPGVGIPLGEFLPPLECRTQREVCADVERLADKAYAEGQVATLSLHRQGRILLADPLLLLRVLGYTKPECRGLGRIAAH